MEFYKITIKKKKDGFGRLFEVLKEIGEFAVSNTEIICKSDIHLDDISSAIKSVLSDADVVEIAAIKNASHDVQNLQLIDWIKKEQFIDRSKIFNNEVEDRVTAMNEVLDEALKIYEKGGEVSKWQQIKTKMRKQKQQKR